MIEQGATINLRVSALGVNGEGVAKLDGFTVFVDGALPNEEVVTTINLIKPSYAKGSLERIVEPDKDRVKPACSRYDECGGCQIMHLSYEAQLGRKAQLVKDALKHIGGMEDITVLPTIPSPEPFHYRNKIQLPVAKVDNVVTTGFYRRGSHDIVPYERCLTHHISMEETVVKIRDLLQKSTVLPYCESTNTGTLRHLLIRANDKGEQLIGLVTTGKQSTEVMQLAKSIQDTIKNVVGVVESINRKRQNVILGETSKTLTGKPFLLQFLCDLTFKISLESFFQVNLSAAKLLYQTALSLAEIDKTTVVLDAYCGIGTLSLLAARVAKQVIGVECVRQAIQDAKENAKWSNITNAKFIVGRVEENSDLFKGIDVALINPPRKGLDQRVVEAIKKYGPKRVVYISCNPATLARDVRALTEYTVKKVQPVDMFPQTMHVETVLSLERR